MKKEEGEGGGMDTRPERDVTAEFEKALEAADNAPYVLRLYVTGFTPRSVAAIEAIKHVCEKYLEGRYDLEVVDISKHRELAQDEQIIAVPTLLKRLPLPLRRLVGDLSNEERVLLGLDLRARS